MHVQTIRLLSIAALWGLAFAPATPPADVSGSWAVTITAADGTITGKAFLKQVDDKVTGTIGPSADATIPIEGVITGVTLALTTKPQPGRTAAFETCELTVGDARMTGAIHGGDIGKGTIEFVRTDRQHDADNSVRFFGIRLP
jgi:hypothetical protein